MFEKGEECLKCSFNVVLLIFSYREEKITLEADIFYLKIFEIVDKAKKPRVTKTCEEYKKDHNFHFILRNFL